MKYLTAFYFINDTDGSVSCPFCAATNSLKTIFEIIYEKIKERQVRNDLSMPYL